MKRQRWVWCGGALLGVLSWAVLNAGASQRAHVHGIGRLHLVVEGTQVTLTLETPAESVYGFEHEARSAADQQKRDAALAQLREKMPQMVIFEARLGCMMAVQKVEVVATAEEHQAQEKHTGKHKTGEHSAVHAEFVVTCQKPLAGSQVKFGITKVFPRLRTVHVQVLSETRQFGTEIKQDRGSITL